MTLFNMNEPICVGLNKKLVNYGGFITLGTYIGLGVKLTLTTFIFLDVLYY